MPLKIEVISGKKRKKKKKKSTDFRPGKTSGERIRKIRARVQRSEGQWARFLAPICK